MPLSDITNTCTSLSSGTFPTSKFSESLSGTLSSYGTLSSGFSETPVLHYSTLSEEVKNLAKKVINLLAKVRHFSLSLDVARRLLGTSNIKTHDSNRKELQMILNGIVCQFSTACKKKNELVQTMESSSLPMEAISNINNLTSNLNGLNLKIAELREGHSLLQNEIAFLKKLARFESGLTKLHNLISEFKKTHNPLLSQDIYKLITTLQQTYKVLQSERLFENKFNNLVSRLREETNTMQEACGEFLQEARGELNKVYKRVGKHLDKLLPLKKCCAILLKQIRMLAAFRVQFNDHKKLFNDTQNLIEKLEDLISFIDDLDHLQADLREGKHNFKLFLSLKERLGELKDFFGRNQLSPLYKKMLRIRSILSPSFLNSIDEKMKNSPDHEVRGILKDLTSFPVDKSLESRKENMTSVLKTALKLISAYNRKR